jgi:hypothetical protein
MAKVRKVGYDPNKVEAGTNFVDHPAPAVVKVKCVTANLEETFKSGNEGAHLVFDIIKKPPAKGKKWAQLHLRYVYADNEGEAWMEAQVMDALIGKRVKQYGSAALVGKTCLANLRAEEYEGNAKPGIKGLMPLDSDEFEDDEDDDEEEEDVDDDEEEDEDEEEEDEEGEDDYNDWSLAQIRAELKRRELDSKGRKDDLVTRLEEDDASEDEEDEDEEEEEDEEEVEDYTEWDTAELKAEMKRRGLRVKRGMDDDALVEALEEDDENEEDPLDE